MKDLKCAGSIHFLLIILIVCCAFAGSYARDYRLPSREAVTIGDQRPSISMLTAPNLNPTPAKPLILQFESKEYIGKATFNIIGMSTGIANRIVAFIDRGRNSVKFDGNDALGSPLPNGIYNILMTTGTSSTRVGKITIAR